MEQPVRDNQRSPLIKTKVKLSTVVLISALLLVSCAKSSKTNTDGNLICAFVEDYNDQKTFALISAAEGDSAQAYIQSDLEGLSEGISSESEVQIIYNKFFKAMTSWGARVDTYTLVQNKSDLSSAARELEAKIDDLALLCKNLGWTFKNNWR